MNVNQLYDLIFKIILTVRCDNGLRSRLIWRITRQGSSVFFIGRHPSSGRQALTIILMACKVIRYGGKMSYLRDSWNHNWVELYDTDTGHWVHVNVPPTSPEPNTGPCAYSESVITIYGRITPDSTPNTGLCSFNESTGCDYSPTTGPAVANKPSLAVCLSDSFPESLHAPP